jgi:GNAT superfamily N-acetyltransferase
VIVVRPIEASDSLEELTELLHRAYSSLLAMGLRFVATSQNVETTRARVESGTCLVAVDDGAIVGTITLYMPNAEEACEFYRRPGVAHFGQFGVEPSAQGSGVGKQLLDEVERMARERGCTHLALDTSEKATHLIEVYERWRYRIVHRVQWESVNYRSVVMAKEL